MANLQKKYETEVQVGLLVLIVIFLGLNLSSNYILFNAKNLKRDQISNNLYTTALAISRNYQKEIIPELNVEQVERLKRTYNLSGLILLPTLPHDADENSKKDWFISIARKLPAKQIPEIAQKLLTSEYNSLTRGENNEYFFVYPVIAEKEKKLLILSKNLPELAYYDNASQTQLLISIVTILAGLLIYLLLYRHILAPFKKLKKEAENAGRTITTGNGEVASVVDDYQHIIKELKEKEAELIIANESIRQKADSLEKFNEYLLTSISAGVITIDTQGKIHSLNKSARKIFDVKESSLKQVDYKTVSFLPSQCLALIEQTLLDNKQHPYLEMEIELIGGKVLQVGMTVSPVYDNHTTQLGAAILVNDLSEIKELRQELEQNRQMVALGEMSAGLAHQLRNSLGAITGYNTLVKKRLEKKQISTEAIFEMETELKEAEALISRFLSYTKPFEFNPELENLGDIIENIIESVSIRPDCQNLLIKTDIPTEINKEVLVDSLLLKQAFINIIENSKNAYPDGSGEILISIEISTSNIVVKIKDFGCGIKKENIERIFTPFYSSSPSGTGLGLPLAQKIIALHEGTLSVSSSVDIGTTFTISLPQSLSSSRVTLYSQENI